MEEHRVSGEDHMRALREVDPEIHAVVQKELGRQRGTIELIASENFASRAVLEAVGTVLTNKYAEGLPGKRYYGGCEFVDEAEELAIERAKLVFGAEHANVQPHSGAQANTAVYFAALEPGDGVLSMDLTHGGHLTHGNPVNISGRYFRFEHYGVNRETEVLDYDEVRARAREVRPKLIVAGTSSYPRIIDFARFREIADEVGALFMVDMAHFAGLVAGGVYPSPVPHAHFVTSTTHKTLAGTRGGFILCKAEWAARIDRAVFPGTQGGPLMHVIAAKAVTFRQAMTDSFREYQRRIVDNARALAEELTARGYRLVSGGTDTHLMLVDLTPLGVTGKEAQEILESAGITANRNSIPFDSRGPNVTSGIRFGTPAVTMRGMGEAEMREIGALIDTALRHKADPGRLAEVRERAVALCRRFPLYPAL